MHAGTMHAHQTEIITIMSRSLQVGLTKSIHLKCLAQFLISKKGDSLHLLHRHVLERSTESSCAYQAKSIFHG